MSKRKLLLADDSVTIQKVVNLTFADEGIEVITVGDGDSAMDRIAHDAPDIVLADVHMPGLNGYQVCELLRENPATNRIPVVLLVGSFEPFDEGEAERVGASAYLTKPFQSIRQLVSQVSELIQAGSSPAEHHDVQSSPEVEDPGVAEELDVAAATGEAVSEQLPDTTDIDALYQRSLSPPGAIDNGDEAESRSGEMFEARTEGIREAGPEDSPTPDTAPAPYVDVGMDDEMIETRSGDQAKAEPTADIDTIRTEEREFVDAEASERDAPSPFDTLASAGDDDNGASALESQAGESYFDQLAATEQIAASERPDLEEFELDEIELLDLPPLENGKTLEFTTTERMIAMGEKKQVVSLSPELMDVIVEKVVERLSEKY